MHPGNHDIAIAMLSSSHADPDPMLGVAFKHHSHCPGQRYFNVLISVIALAGEILMPENG